MGFIFQRVQHFKQGLELQIKKKIDKERETLEKHTKKNNK